jgi:membrane-associated phospholipid phosphatase
VSMGTSRSVVALWIALLFAGSILAFMARGAGPLPGDLALTGWLQEWLPPDGLIGSSLAYAGRLVWLLPIGFLAVALLGRRWFAALFVLVAAVTGLLLGDALKLLVARARPSVELVWIYEPSGGYGFPSTTALLSVVLLGTVCYLLGREQSRRPLVAVVVCVSLLLVLASGISRIDIGEHWATDILGGWLFGSAWLLVLIFIHRRWSSMQGRPRMAQ